MGKKLAGGKLSTYVHEKLKVGDKVALSAPFGVFVAPDVETDVVLMSAGIGITPMVNLHRACEKTVKLAVHGDRTPESHPYKSHFDHGGVPTLYKYTKVDGGKRPTASELVEETFAKVGKDNEFFICGSEQWMDDVQKELLAKGAKKVMRSIWQSVGNRLSVFCFWIIFLYKSEPKGSNFNKNIIFFSKHWYCV